MTHHLLATNLNINLYTAIDEDSFLSVVYLKVN